jgi:rRNA maturation endonuclease Nob1
MTALLLLLIIVAVLKFSNQPKPTTKRTRRSKGRRYDCFGCGREYRYKGVNVCPFCGRRPCKTW